MGESRYADVLGLAACLGEGSLAAGHSGKGILQCVRDAYSFHLDFSIY